MLGTEPVQPGVELVWGFVITMVTGFTFFEHYLCFRWGLVCQRAFLSATALPAALGPPLGACALESVPSVHFPLPRLALPLLIPLCLLAWGWRVLLCCSASATVSERQKPGFGGWDFLRDPAPLRIRRPVMYGLCLGWIPEASPGTKSSFSSL